LTITASCQCGATYTAPARYAGRRVKCRNCGQAFVVPDDADAAAAARSFVPSASPPSATAADIDANERVLYDERRAMFRDKPVAFILGALFGIVSAVSAAFDYVFLDPVAGEVVQPATINAAMAAATAALFGAWWITCLQDRLIITTYKTILRHGLVARRVSVVRHKDARNVGMSQGFFQRLFDVGDVLVSASGHPSMQIKAKGFPRPKLAFDLVYEWREKCEQAGNP